MEFKQSVLGLISTEELIKELNNRSEVLFADIVTKGQVQSAFNELAEGLDGETREYVGEAYHSIIDDLLDDLSFHFEHCESGHSPKELVELSGQWIDLTQYNRRRW